LEFQFHFDVWEKFYHPEATEIKTKWKKETEEPLFDSSGSQHADLMTFQSSQKDKLMLIKRKHPDSNGHFIMGLIQYHLSKLEELPYLAMDIEEALPSENVVVVYSLASRPKMQQLRTKNGKLMGIGSLLMDMVERRHPKTILFLYSKIESTPFYFKKGFRFLNPVTNVPRHLEDVERWMDLNNQAPIEEVSVQDFVNEHLENGRKNDVITSLHMPMYKILPTVEKGEFTGSELKSDD
jgi:hypothetical protein